MKLTQIIYILSTCLVLLCTAQHAMSAPRVGSAPLIYPRFQHIGSEDGLTAVRITSLLQDRQGFLWISTLDGGLVRYDGYTFRSFRHDPRDSTSLSSSAVETVFEDSRGRLWVGTSKGLNRFEAASERFSRIRLSSNSVSDKTTIAVTSIDEDTTGALWIGTSNGVFRLSVLDTVSSGDFASALQFSHILPVPENSESIKNWIEAVEIDRAGMIWIGTRQGLGQVLPNTVEQELASARDTLFRFHPFLPETGSAQALATDDINTITEDGDGHVWVLAGSIYKINRSRNSLKTTVDTINVPSGPHYEPWYAILDMAVGEKPYFWVGGFRYLVNVDVSNEVFTQIPIDANDVNSPTRFSIRALLKDQSGVIWVGTMWGGLYKYDPLAQFSQYHPTLQQIRQNTSSNLRFVCEDSQGDLWLVADKVYHCDRRNGQTKFVIGKKDLPLPAYYLNHIFEDDAKNIWLATANRGFFRLDPGSQRIVDHYPNKGFEWFGKTGEMSQVDVIELSQDRAGTIWAPAVVQEINQESRSVLFELNLSASQLKVHPLPSWDGTHGIDEFFYDLQLAESGTVWLATQIGLQRFDKQSGQFRRFQHDSGDSTSLSHDRVKSICLDPVQPHRYVWLGTEDGGLNLFDIEKETFRPYTVMDGLPSNHISSILSDEGGHLWLGTDNGISKITLGKESRDIKSIRNYDRRDGLHGNDFTFYYGQNAAKTARGELIFTGPKGFNIFHPDNIKENSSAPRVLISGLQINYEQVSVGDGDSPLEKQIGLTKEIELPYDRNTLTFEMTALDFRVPEKNRYAYEMEGYDREWIDSGFDRSAHYTGLPWGDYLFRVRAANSDGVWNEEGATLKITITPPWWRTSLAYAIYGICLFGILYVARRFEMSRQRFKHRAEFQRLETEKLKDLDNLKSNFFANISHEFRTPLTLILGPTEELSSTAPDKKSRQRLNRIHRNASRLLQLINQLLDLSKLDANKMHLQASQGDFIAFLKGLVMSFESWAQSRGIDLRFAVNDTRENGRGADIPVDTSTYFDPDGIEKIFSNLLSNSFKFTPEGGRVEISATFISGCRWGLSGSEHTQKYEIRSPKCLVCSHVSNDNGRHGPTPANICVEVIIQDTGSGIPSDRLPHIFDRFYQVDTSSTCAHEGTGIGLALVKELVELHNGSIEVKSEQGQGTTFTVCLPLGKEHLKPDEIVAGVNIPLNLPSKGDLQKSSLEGDFLHSPLEGGQGGVAVSADQSKPSTDIQQPAAIDDTIILIIEDNADVRAYIRDHLEPDYKIIEAKDGEEGVNKAVETIPDLVISDVMMPKKNGYQVCQQLKTDERTSHIPVILLTAKAAAEEKIAGLETGADAYVLKPFRPKELAVRVRKLIETRRKLRARFKGQIVLKPSQIAVTSRDEAFLKRVLEVVEEHIGQENFGVEMLGRKLGMSTSQINRKLKALVNQTANQLIRSLRLQRAADLLQQNAGNIAEIAYQVGFSSQAHFSTAFQKQFGCSPRAFKRGECENG
ncbi:MAG: two-component regulator propeller domain-containing protein [bacterium]